MPATGIERPRFYDRWGSIAKSEHLGANPIGRRLGVGYPGLDEGLCSRMRKQMTFHYFAYGSNMLPSRLLDRCPSAKLIGVGIAANVRLEFSKTSKDGSGKATLAPLGGSTVPGVIFTIDTAERAALDKYEGLGLGYWRDDAFPVRALDSGTIVETSTYLATSRDPKLMPFDWYLATVIAGALYHGIAEDHVSLLRNTAFVEDTRSDRQTRTVAIRAMRDHGIDDFRTVLGR